ncbi:MAG: metal-sulfur cluster assembly factor [Nitrospirota bacterium]|jgi:metal-sulfur cluster biosynthetic enzyme
MNIDEIRTALREVIDPEVGVNVVDLGLLYGIELEGAEVRVRLTMTSPACPLGAHLREQVESAIRRHCPDAGIVTVDLVWDPPWSPERMSDEAKRALGW